MHFGISRAPALVVWVLVSLSVKGSPAATHDVDLSCGVFGRLSDVSQSIQQQGYPFQVNLRRLSYRGHVERAVLEQNREDLATLWISLRNVTLTIDQTVITGQPGGANCGPMQLALAHQRPLWIGFDFQHAAAGQQWTLLGPRTQLTADNVSVGAPQWIQTHGFGVTRAAVAEGLRNGLMRNVQRIEQELLKAAPVMLTHFDSMLEHAPAEHQLLLRAMAAALSRPRSSQGRTES